MIFCGYGVSLIFIMLTERLSVEFDVLRNAQLTPTVALDN